MVPEEPPRHSKSTDEPVTIDRSAEDVTATDKTAPQDLTETEVPPAQEPIASESERHDEPVPDDKPAAAEAVDATPISAPFGRDTATPQQKQTATSALIAAGIFGGIVALAGAGAMQYAGYLPSASPAATVDTSGLSAEIEALKRQVTTLASTPASSTDTSALEQRLSALEQKADTAPAIDSGAVAAIDQKVTALAGTVEQAKAEAASAAQAGAGISGRLDAIEKKLQEPQNDGRVARAIAMTGIKAAVDRGGPFTAELDALQTVSPDDPAVETLRPAATAGVLSRAELVARFPDTAFAMLEAINQPSPDSGFADRLLTSALSIVKVREVGDVAGAGPDAIIARIEDKLGKGDLTGAATEWQSLPDAAKAAGATFKTALDERIKVEDLVGAAMSAGNKQI